MLRSTIAKKGPGSELIAACRARRTHLLQGNPTEGAGVIRRLSRGAEALVPPRQSVTIGMVCWPVGQDDPRFVQLLQAVQEHGAVGLLAYVTADVHGVVGRYPDQVVVVGGMVDLAQTQPVLDDRITMGLAVRNDVRGVKQSAMAKPAQGAASA